MDVIPRREYSHPETELSFDVFWESVNGTGYSGTIFSEAMRHVPSCLFSLISYIFSYNCVFS